MRRPLTLAIPVLIVSILACNVPAGIAGNEAGAALTLVAQTFTALAQPTATAGTPTATLSVTNTPTVGATSTALPCNLAHFVTDVTVPDNTTFDLNANFTKTWRLQNVGSCTWTSGYKVVFDSGDMMSGPQSQQLTNGTIPPGGTIDLSVDLKAPNVAGTYKGNWRLRDPNGVTFGLSTGPFWVQIKAKAGNAVLPDWPVLRNGDSSVEVMAMQHLLKQAGQDLTADGIFGPITVTKVKAFQSANGLTSDGIVGPQTWSKLIVQVQQGSHGQAVRAVQVLLSGKFAYPLITDGDFGAETDSTVRKFQAFEGIDVDGIVGPKTWRMLLGAPPI